MSRRNMSRRKPIRSASAGAAVATITGLSPSFGHEGDSPTVVTISGTNFTSAVNIRINGVIQSATYVDAGQLTSTFGASVLTTSGTYTVTLKDGTGSATFTTYIVPTITGITPTSKNLSDATFTLSVSGTNFNANTVITISGAPRATTVVNAGLMTTGVSGYVLNAAGTYAVNISRGTGADVNLVVSAASYAMTGITPATAYQWDAATTLTVSGSSFDSNVKIVIDGTPVTTSFVDSGTITYAIPAAENAGSLLQTAGTKVITISGSTGAGTGTANFTVSAYDFNTPTGLTSWYNPISENLTLSAGSTKVHELFDDSANAYNLSATGVRRPDYVATDAGFNNLPSLTFDGTGNRLNSVVGMSGYISLSAGTMFVVANLSSVAGRRPIFGGQASATLGNAFCTLSGELEGVITDTALTGYYTTNDITVGTPFVAEWTLSAGTLYTRLGLGSYTSVSGGAGSVAYLDSTLCIGGIAAGFFSAMSFAQGVTYNVALTPTERDRLVRKLKVTFNL